MKVKMKLYDEKNRIRDIYIVDGRYYIKNLKPYSILDSSYGRLKYLFI